jgi:hypothetical protein
MSSYDVEAQRVKLLAQLDEIAQLTRSRPMPRDQLAIREIIAVHPVRGMQLAAEQLDDTRADSRLIGIRPESGVVLLDVASAELSYLRDKIEAFGDDAEIVSRKQRDGTTTTHRAHERAIAPIETISLAPIEDVWGESRLLGERQADGAYWLEIACRGGYRNPQADSQRSRAQICRQLNELGALPQEKVGEFLAPEQIYFFARLTRSQLETLRAATDCIYDVALAPAPIRDLYLLEDTELRDLSLFKLTPPAPDAPSVVILDTGIATGHPLLKDAILSATAAGRRSFSSASTSSSDPEIPRERC